MTQRLLITGATGLLGNNVARAACAQGHHVRVLIRPSTPTLPVDDLPVEIVRGEITDTASIQNAVQDCDAVIHSAGLVYIGWDRLDAANQVNGEGTRMVADAAREAGARLIHISTTNTLAVGRRTQPANEETQGDRQVPCSYVTSKRLAESHVREAIANGLDAVIIHPGFMLGPWDWKPSSGELICGLAKHWSPLVPMGGVTVCDPRDVAEGILTAVQRGVSGRNYILGGENWTHFRLWKEVSRQIKRFPPLSPIGPMWPAIAGRVTDLMSRMGVKERQVNSAALKIASQFHWYDSARAETELNYRSRAATESISDAIEWFQSRNMLS